MNAESLLQELSQLWHTSRVPCGLGRYPRMLWVSKQFSSAHPEFSETASYKAIDRMTARLPLANDGPVLQLLNTILDKVQ